MSGEWIEVPAFRILKVDRDLFKLEFDLLDHNGEPCPAHCVPYMIRRRTDNKLFKPARFRPTWAADEVMLDLVYLEEW